MLLGVPADDMQTYVIMDNYGETICLEENASALKRHYIRKGYHVIGRVKCDKRIIEMKGDDNCDETE